MGYKPTTHEEAKNLHGFTGDTRQQKAHVIIPRSQVGSASNDVGFERQSNGKYIMHLSAYDTNRFKTNQLKQFYAKNKLLNTVQRGGKYKLKKQSIEADGKIHITIQVGR